MRYSPQPVPLTSFYSNNHLIADYLGNRQQLQPYFEYEPVVESFAQVIAARRKFAVNRHLLADTLKEQYRNYLTPETESQIEQLRNEHTFTVVASHQPCLLLGPVYNALKICGVIHLAKRVMKQHSDICVVPVFWLGSEDHDLDELAQVNIGGQQLKLETDYNGPIGRMPAVEVLQFYRKHEVLLRQQLNDKMFELMCDSAQRFETFGHHTHHLLHQLFGSHGLIVIDQDHKALKQQFSSVMLDELQHKTAQRVLQPQLDRLAAGYHVQATPRPCNLFYLSEEGRNRIEQQDNRFQVLNTGITFSYDELVQELNRHTDRFSPNVILRPLFQELILPNLAFVGGGAEVSYWLELKQLFEHYQIHYPMVLLRNSAAFLTHAVLRKVQQLGIGYEILLQDEATAQKKLMDDIGSAIDLDEEAKSLHALYEAIEAKLMATDASLAAAVRAELQKALSGIENLWAKAARAEKRKHDTDLQRLHHVFDHLYPQAIAQERSQAFLPLVQHPDLIGQLAETLDPLAQTFVVFEPA